MNQFRLSLHGADPPLTWTLEGKRWTVGRHVACDVRLDDPKVSRRHALLYLEGTELWIRDLGARNPILVNDETLSVERRLAPGDRVRLGQTDLAIETTHLTSAQIVQGGPKLEEQTTRVVRFDPGAAFDTGTQILRRLADSLGRAQTAADASLSALNLISSAVPLRRGLVARVDPKQTLRVLASIEPRPELEGPVRIWRSMVSIARREGTAVCFQPGESTKPIDTMCMVAPLIFQGTLQGLVYLEHASSEPPCTETELELAACIGRTLASRIELLDLLREAREENTNLRQRKASSSYFVGQSRAASQVRAQCEAIAKRNCDFLVLGETGVGKETAARHIHEHGGPRGPDRPFVVVEAQDRTQSDLDMELFGSDARSTPGSKLLVAHRGTLLLRNVDELPREIQERLVQEIETARVDVDGKPTRLDVRLAATSTLEREQLFRDPGPLAPGLSARLSGTLLEIPPLRDRLDDLSLLATLFLAGMPAQETRADMLSPRALDRLRAHAWPANVAELRHVLIHAGLVARGDTILPKDLPRLLGPPRTSPSDLPTLEEVEKRHIEYVLEAVGGNKVMAARVLGIATSTLYLKIKRYEISG